MTLIGLLVFLSWLPAAIFFVMHAWAMIRARERNLPGISVLVLSTAVFLALTVTMFRRTLGNPLPDSYVTVIFLMTGVALWFQLLSFMQVRYGRQAREPDDNRSGVHR